jgi:hypothetical protein
MFELRAFYAPKRERDQRRRARGSFAFISSFMIHPSTLIHGCQPFAVSQSWA